MARCIGTAKYPEAETQYEAAHLIGLGELTHG